MSIKEKMDNFYDTYMSNCSTTIHEKANSDKCNCCIDIECIDWDKCVKLVTKKELDLNGPVTSPDLLLKYREKYYFIEFQCTESSHSLKEHISKISETYSLLKKSIFSPGIKPLKYIPNQISIEKYIILINEITDSKNKNQIAVKSVNSSSKASSTHRNYYIHKKTEVENPVREVFKGQIKRLNLITIQNFGFECTCNVLERIKTIEDIINS